MNPTSPDTPAVGRSTPESPIDTAQLLEDAADLLLIHGVCRNGAWSDDEGRLCAVGAIRRASQGRDDANLQARGALVSYLSSHGLHHGHYAWWNDNTETDDEVRDTLLLVAKDLRNEAVAT